MADEYYDLLHEGEDIDETINGLASHVVDNVIHVSALDRENWNGKVSPQSVYLKTETDQLLQQKADKTAAVSSVIYNTTNAPVLQQTINGVTSNIETPDTTPASNSKHLMTSGGVYTALSGKSDKTETVSGVAYDTSNAPALKQTVNGTTSTIETPDTTPTENSKHLLTSGGAFAAIAARPTKGYVYGTDYDAIPANTDLNDVQTPGVYNCDSVVNVKTLKNTPFQDATVSIGNTGYNAAVFRMIVECINSTGTLRQTLIPLHTDAEFFVRIRSSSTWRPWKVFNGTSII